MDEDRSIRRMNRFEKILDTVSFTPLGVIALLALILLPLAPPFNREYLIRWLIAGALLSAQAIAFDFTAGYIHIVNFAIPAFFGLGGYTSALMVIHFGLSPWVGIFCGALSSGLMGFLTGVITLRLRGLFASLLAFFAAFALMGLATKLVSVTRGPLGLISPLLFETSSNLPYFYVVLFMVIVIYSISRKVTRSHIGLAFKAIGQNMEAARTSGVNPTRYRIINFTLSYIFVGWAGGFYAHYYGILTPDVMDTLRTVEIMAVVYIGGRGSLWGGTMMGFLFVCAMEMVRSSLANYPGLNLIIYGLVLIIAMIYFPGGIAQIYQNVLSQTRSKTIRFLSSSGKA